MLIRTVSRMKGFFERSNLPAVGIREIIVRFNQDEVALEQAIPAPAPKQQPCHPEVSGESWAESKDLKLPAGFRAELCAC